MAALKGQPANEPILVETSVEAEAPVERVFELLDFAAPGNALRERGFLFLEESPGTLGRFRVIEPICPDLVFTHDVDLFEWPRRLRYETRYEPGGEVGLVARTISDYNLSSTGPETSRIQLVEKTFLRVGITARDYRIERSMLILAAQRQVTRLCVHAALGVDAAMRVG